MNNIQKTTKKSILQNIYFIGTLLGLSLLDLIYKAFHHDYKVLNIIFSIICLFYFIDLLRIKYKK